MEVTPRDEDIISQLAMMVEGRHYINRTNLIQHGLYNEETLKILFLTEGIDYISFNEAFRAFPAKRGILLSRNRQINAQRSDIERKLFNKKYIPGQILDSIAEYNIILQNRDKYIYIDRAMTLLNIRSSKKRSFLTLFNKISMKKLKCSRHTLTMEEYNYLKSLRINHMSIDEAQQYLSVSTLSAYRLIWKAKGEIIHGWIDRNIIEAIKGKINQECGTPIYEYAEPLKRKQQAVYRVTYPNEQSNILQSSLKG